MNDDDDDDRVSKRVSEMIISYFRLSLTCLPGDTSASATQAKESGLTDASSYSRVQSKHVFIRLPELNTMTAMSPTSTETTLAVGAADGAALLDGGSGAVGARDGAVVGGSAGHQWHGEEPVHGLYAQQSSTLRIAELKDWCRNSELAFTTHTVPPPRSS